MTILKYLAFPAVLFYVWFLGGKDIPLFVYVILGLFSLSFELSLIPFDLGQLVEDETHTYPYKVQRVPMSKGGSLRVKTKYYSRSGLFLAKFFGWSAFVVLLGIIFYLYLLFKK